MKLPVALNPSRSLATKITVWVVITILAVFLVLTLFIQRTTAEGIFLEANARYMGMLAGNNERVNATLKSVEAAIGNTVPLVEENLDRPDRLYGLVERVVALNPDIVGSAIAFEPYYYPEKGKQFSPYAYRIGNTVDSKQLGSPDYEYHYMDWYQIPKLLGKPYWSEPYYDTDGGNTMMTTYSLPLRNNDGELYAIFTADVALEWLSSMMEETDSINNSEGALGQGHAYSFIIGRGGTYIAHPDRERVLNETYFSHAMETADTLDDYAGYQMIAGCQGNAHLDGSDTLSIYYSPIERTGWSMAIVVPDAEIVAGARRAGYIILGLMLLGLLAVILVCRYAIGRITKPLTRFAASADEISLGHFDTPLPDVKTHDEMRHLHDSFLTMQHSLNQQIQETARVTEQKGRIESELHIARSIQMAMLPKTFPPYPDRDEISIYGQLTPAKEVGGDLYDFYIREDKLFFCIGDVSGKGVPASLVMAVTRALFRTISSHESQPDRIVSLLNDTIAEDNETNMFVTMFVGVIDLPTGYMQYCNAGHDAPLLISKGGRRIGLLPVDSNLPAGVMYGWKFSLQDTSIDNGTTIFLYTDGLTEAEDINHGQFGEDRIFDSARTCCLSGQMTPRRLLEQMTDDIHAFVGEAEQSDDLTMMAIQYDLKRDIHHHHSLTLPNDVEAVPQLHEFIEEVAEAAQLDASLTMSLNLAIEEAVVNVMNYAYPPGTQGTINLFATTDDHCLTMIISDTGTPFDPTAKEEVDTTLSAEDRPIGGLGIHLIRQIMDSVEYEYVDGKNVLTLKKTILPAGNEKTE